MVGVPATLSLLFGAPGLWYRETMRETQSGFLWAIDEVNNSTDWLPDTQLTSYSGMTSCNLLSGIDLGNEWRAAAPRPSFSPKTPSHRRRHRPIAEDTVPS
jgi:hypothetical protein